MKYPALFILLLLCCFKLPAQQNIKVLRDFKRVDIPFEYENNLLIVNVLFNRFLPLKFIFDTGAEHTILSKKGISDMLQVNYEREFRLLGSDMQTELVAYLARGIDFKIAGMDIYNHSILVLKDDYFHFEEIVGLDIHGILGADIFRGLVVKINYERKVITLFRSDYFSVPDDYKQVPVKVYRNKIYLDANVSIQQDSFIKIRLLLDTGASLAFLLHTDTHPSLQLPPHTLKGKIGAGLGGYLEGYLGRVSRLDISDFQFNEVLTNFQELQVGIDSSLLYSRNGIVGNQLLDRIHLIIDYPREKVYMKRNRHFKEAFEFDKSGLVVIASGAKLNTLVIHEVLEGSPAAEAGLMPGDQILRVNSIIAPILGIQDVHRICRKKVGKKVTIVIRRNGVKMKKRFRLRQLI